MVNRKLKVFGITELELVMLVGILAAFKKSQTSAMKGIRLNQAKPYNNSIIDLNKAIEIDTPDADEWYYKGLDLIQEFKITEADAAMDNALLLNPNNSIYNVGKSLVLLLQGKYEDAENYADKGLMLNPKNAIGWGVKGIIAESKGDRTAANFHYDKAIELNPDDTISWKELHKL